MPGGRQRYRLLPRPAAVVVGRTRARACSRPRTRSRSRSRSSPRPANRSHTHGTCSNRATRDPSCRPSSTPWSCMWRHRSTGQPRRRCCHSRSRRSRCRRRSSTDHRRRSCRSRNGCRRRRPRSTGNRSSSTSSRKRRRRRRHHPRIDRAGRRRPRCSSPSPGCSRPSGSCNIPRTRKRSSRPCTRLDRRTTVGSASTHSSSVTDPLGADTRRRRCRRPCGCSSSTLARSRRRSLLRTCIPSSRSRNRLRTSCSRPPRNRTSARSTSARTHQQEDQSAL